ncbi:hypothetical protein D3C73_1228840 [compost metagenome]
MGQIIVRITILIQPEAARQLCQELLHTFQPCRQKLACVRVGIGYNIYFGIQCLKDLKIRLRCPRVYYTNKLHPQIFADHGQADRHISRAGFNDGSSRPYLPGLPSLLDHPQGRAVLRASPGVQQLHFRIDLKTAVPEQVAQPDYRRISDGRQNAAAEVHPCPVLLLLVI